MTRLFVLIALLVGCSVNKRSADFECATPADCRNQLGNGFTCDNGICVSTTAPDDGNTDPDGPLPPDGFVCPSQCTSCKLESKTCRVDCGASPATCNLPINCPPGFNCEIICSTPSGCSNINCTQGESCNIDCKANNTCKAITCGEGACDIKCDGGNSCKDVDCHNSCACDLECIGLGSCTTEVTCPGEPTQCTTLPRGCTSTDQGCNTCAGN